MQAIANLVGIISIISLFSMLGLLLGLPFIGGVAVVKPFVVCLLTTLCGGMFWAAAEA